MKLIYIGLMADLQKREESMTKIPAYFTHKLIDLQEHVDGVYDGRAIFYDKLDKDQKRHFDMWFKTWIKMSVDQLVRAAKGDEETMRSIKRGY